MGSKAKLQKTWEKALSLRTRMNVEAMDPVSMLDDGDAHIYWAICTFCEEVVSPIPTPAASYRLLKCHQNLANFLTSPWLLARSGRPLVDDF